MSNNVFEDGDPFDDPSWQETKRKRRSLVRQKKRPKFKSDFVRFPTRWVAAMRRAKSSGTAYELALAILDKAFECKTRGHGEVVLSAMMTKMPRNTRRRAAKELVELGLIKLCQGGRQPSIQGAAK